MRTLPTTRLPKLYVQHVQQCTPYLLISGVSQSPVRQLAFSEYHVLSRRFTLHREFCLCHLPFISSHKIHGRVEILHVGK